MWCSKDENSETAAASGQLLRSNELGRADAQPRLRETGRGPAWPVQRIAGTAAALLSSALAPAMLMTAIWHDPKVAPMVFVFTLVIGLGHAVLLGLPIFLILQFRGQTGITACVVFGFAIGVLPVSII